MGIGTPTSRATRIRDYVANIPARIRTWRFSKEETELLPYLRGNGALCDALVALLESRIRLRELSPLPNDPVDCKASMAADRELRWLIMKLDALEHAPMDVNVTDEQTP